MSFDTLAPHYRWMEWILAGNKLQRCRTAFLNQIREPENVLILGEGNGRFLVECRRAFPEARITCVDASAGMLAQAQKRLVLHSGSTAQTEFIHADVLKWKPPIASFELLVTHFFLDCFRADQLEHLIPQLASGAKENATWLLADFQCPAAGWKRVRAAVILWMMHVFFRIATRLPARRLTDPDRFLERAEFHLRKRHITEWGLLHSDCWEQFA